MKCEKCKELEEYKNAYYYLLNYWESFEKEQQREINKELNKIFNLNKCEKVEED